METQTQPIIDFNYALGNTQKNILPMLLEAKRNGEEKLRWFGSYEGHIFDAMDYLISNFYDPGDAIKTNYLFKAIKEAAEIYDRFRCCLEHHSSGKLETWHNHVLGKVKGNSKNEEWNKRCFAEGILLEDYDDSDPDPYQTAGGYRTWKALKGTKVEFFLNKDLSVTAHFKSNCLVDHYNNNICGISIGGGTTKYKIGDRVEKRSINLIHTIFTEEDKKRGWIVKLTRVDNEKLRSLIKEFHPYLIK